MLLRVSLRYPTRFHLDIPLRAQILRVALATTEPSHSAALTFSSALPLCYAGGLCPQSMFTVGKFFTPIVALRTLGAGYLNLQRSCSGHHSVPGGKRCERFNCSIPLSKRVSTLKPSPRFQCRCSILSKYGATHPLARTSPTHIRALLNAQNAIKVLVGYWLACVAICREMAGLTIRAQGFDRCATHRLNGCLTAAELLNYCPTAAVWSRKASAIRNGFCHPSPFSVGVVPSGVPFRDQRFVAPQPLHNRLPLPTGFHS
jgi:hypothetical protein